MREINISHLDNVVNSMELMNLVYAVELGEKKVYMGRSCEILYSKKETETLKMQFYKGKGIKVFQHVVLNTALMLPVCVTVPKQQNAALKNLWIIS